MKDKLSVVKIGGNVIEDDLKLDLFLSQFVKIADPKIIVHGGGKKATEISEKLGIKTEMNNGRRITPKANLDVITMVYGGLINKTIVAQLQAKSCNAMGLTGADANCISAVKRPAVPIDFGYVGDIKSVNAEAINNFLNTGITPVFCAISHDQNGQLLNTNADTIASEIAIAMNNDYDTSLIYCFEKNGVLSDVDNPQSVIPLINTSNFEKLKSDQVIHEGMLPKLDNAFNALNKGVKTVWIRNFKMPNPTIKSGTKITNEDG